MQQPSTPAILALEDGRVFHGTALGKRGGTVGEVCFNTSITGYQEILSDPSYKDQLITFTTPHIGNVGANPDDMESDGVHANGVIVRQAARIHANHRARQSWHDWLMEHGVVGIEGVDTRALTRHLRDRGALRGAIASDGTPAEKLIDRARQWAGLPGRDLLSEVSGRLPGRWRQGSYDLDRASFRSAPKVHTPTVAVLDFGCKFNILNMLVDQKLEPVILPARTTAEEILARDPAGIFLSNGPGDPAAAPYAVETIRRLLECDLPIFGICMGHQLLCQALGLTTFKLKFGHRGGNHPVAARGKVEISSQNHGFAVADEAIPPQIEVTHRSLFDGTIEGIALKDRPVFSVQYHPEASPGPHDGGWLFRRFAEAVHAYAASR
ncbi:MAG: carbamoyl-phosphate synthase small subunit [Zetaproteobacteria bacterium]|nr:MAG: carbamoyl-phosphate synthase small subunit [Zetaproteobacteria bacterium]